MDFAFVPIKVGLREVPPFALVALRFFFASVPLVFFVKRPQMPWRFIAGRGVAIGVLQLQILPVEETGECRSRRSVDLRIARIGIAAQ